MSGRMLIDVTGLLHWYAFARHPSGIQRVIEKLIAAPALRHDSRVELVARPVGDNNLYVVPFELLIGLSIAAERRASIARLRAFFTAGTRHSSLLSLVGAIGPAYIPYICLGRLRLEKGVEAMFGGRWSCSLPTPLPASLPGPDDVLFHPGDLFWQAQCVQALLDLKRRTGVRLVQMVHDLFIEEHPEWFEARFQVHFRGELRRLVPHVDRWVTNSIFVKGRLTRYLDACDLSARPIGVLPMGWDSFDRGTGSVSLLQDGLALRRLGLTDGPFILFVGTVEPRKNLATLLDAFEALGVEFEDRTPELVVVGGDGWKSAEVKARLRQTRGVRWFRAASDTDLAVLYRHARFTVAPSFSEGWGLPVQESLAHGVPCIASTGGAMAEAAQGLAKLFNPKDAMALRRAMAHWITDDAALQAARTRVAFALARNPLPTWNDAANSLLRYARE
jgi:glycosyltransferase involved in cell wall biosynthesis